MGQAAELHALGGFLVQVRGFFRVVGIDGDDNAAAGHQCRVVRNRIVCFDLVSPPIGKVDAPTPAAASSSATL